MRVSVDEFLARVASLYDAPQAPGRKGTVAISCKSVPSTRVFAKGATTGVFDADVLLFRAAKYGNNRHKAKYSVVISSNAQAAFHSQLSHIVKTKAEHRARGVVPTAKRSGKKATE